MTPPRHLWSGDWRRESAAAAEELAKQRGETGQGSGPARVPDSAQPETAPQARPETAPTAGLRPLPGSARTEQPRAAAPPKPRPAAASPKPPPARRPPNRPLRPPGVPRTWQPVLAVGLLALLIAGGAYALVDSAGGSGASGAPWLGVEVASTPVPDGALVESVSPGSPAARAGVQPGDVITQIGEQTVNTPGDVRALIAGRRPGDQVEIGIERGLLTYTTDATLSSGPGGAR